MAGDSNHSEAASPRDAPREGSPSSLRLTKSTTTPSTKSSLSRGHRRRQSQQAPETPSDAASKTSIRSSETSGSAESESRASRHQSPSLLTPKSVSRRAASPAGRFKGIFRSKKSHSNLRKEASPERTQPDAVPDRHPDPVSHPQADPPPKIEPASPEPSAAKPPSRAGRLPQPKLDTSVRPRTPPRSESGPTIVSTPPTPTYTTSTRPGLSGPRHTTGSESPPSTAESISAASSPPSVLSAHRRLQTGTAGPSKLSNSTPAPPTPEASTTGTSGNTGSPAASSGFFSSVFSAAQNAANSFSTSIQPLAPGGNKATKTGQPELSTLPPGAPDEGVEVQALAREMPEDQITDTKEPAINTLGSGDLSLSQLGLSDPSLETSAPSPARSPSPRLDMDRRTRSESTPAVPSPSLSRAPYSSTFADDFSTSKSRSLNEQSSGGDKTPPTVSLLDDKPVRPGVNRSGSVRSAMGRHRKRGSSAATGYTTNTDKTGTTIGAAIVAANASFAHPRGPQGAPKLTGFAIASKRRNRDFHNQFKSVPDDDYLIEDYSCALQREILAHGRLYVSEGHLCFSSNILGWMTTLVLSFDEIVSVEKRSTAMLFKNGLMISTLHNRHVFASFTNRDATYDLVIKIWQLGHPKLQSTLNGIRLEGPGGDKTERIEDDDAAADGDDQSLSGSEDDSEDDIYDEDDESVDLMDASQLTDGSAADGDAERVVARKASGGAVVNGTSLETPGKEDAANGAAFIDFPGPASHPPTDCGDAANHFDKITGDDVIPAPMGKVFNFLFGTQSPTWISKFLTDSQKCTDLQMEDMRALGGDNMSRTYSYTKPLPGGIGPKQTRCIINETIENLDFEKAVNLVLITQTPDVPSGNVFCVKTRYCLSWADNNRTRVQVNCGIEWSGKSWIKGPIENGAREGQSGYTKDLFTSLRSTLEARPGAAGAPRKKKGRKARAQQATAAAAAEAPKVAPKRDWGLLEPARSVLEPFLDIIAPILTGNVVYGLLVGLLVAAWFGFGLNGGRRYDERVLGPYGYPERVAAYEEMWRREESELWEWLEERVGMHRLGSEGVRTVVEPRVMEEKVGAVGGAGREVEEAIRVTEEKLRVLKEVVERG